MGKIFETKERILRLLKSKPRTREDIAKELGLSPSTISQHLEELQEKGLVKKQDHQHSKRWKYYEINPVGYEKYIGERMNYSKALYLVIVIAVIASIAYIAMNVKGNAPITNQTLVVRSIGTACPFIASPAPIFSPYLIQGFSEFNVSGYSDYVLAQGSKGEISYRVSISNSTSLPGGGNYIRLYNRALMYSSQDVNGTTVYSYNTTGVRLTLIPNNSTIQRGSDSTFSVIVNASPNAPERTYLMEIGQCEGDNNGIILITIGNGPYSGKVSVAPQIYG